MTKNIAAFVFVSFFALFFLGHTATARQDDTVQEKLYVHINKAFYMPGEILWFRVFALDAHTLAPSVLSEVAYIEILNGEGGSVLQAKVELGKSNGGSFYIPHELPTGTYQFVAYTNWMKNLGSERFFSKSIQLLNPFAENEHTVQPILKSQHLQLFPESGILLPNVDTRVAYKLVSPEEGAETFEAVVLEDDSVSILRLKSNARGMGSFLFTPEPGKQYTMRAFMADGSTVDAPFPKTDQNGYLFNVNKTQDKNLNLSVSASPQHANKRMVLRVKSQDRTLKTFQVELDDAAKASLQIGSGILPPGLVCLTLIDGSGMAVAERLVFSYPDKKLDVSVEIDAQKREIREAFNVKIRTSVGERPAASDLSVSIYKIDSLQAAPFEDIESFLWLQSEVKGNIMNAKSYFSGANIEQRERDMDDLLLTQGWRKIKPLHKENKMLLPEHKSHLIAFRYTDKLSNLPFTGKTVFLSLPDSYSRLHISITDSNGVAKFNVDQLYGTRQLATGLVSDQEAHVELLSPFVVGHDAPMQTEAKSPLPEMGDQLLAHSINVQAENAYAKRARAQFLQPAIDSVPFYGRADKSYRLDDYTRFVLMQEVLQEYVPEVSVRKRGDNFRLTVLDYENRVHFSNDPLILLDGIPIANANDIIAYDPLKVQQLDIITGKYFYGPLVYDGVVVFNTYKGMLEDFALSPATTLLSYEGLQYEREFYVPLYETETQKKARLPDMRNALFWKPNVVLDRSGEANLIVNTSDLAGDYIIVVQGLDNQGNVGSTTSLFTVN